jgi:hypothetical protein
MQPYLTQGPSLQGIATPVLIRGLIGWMVRNMRFGSMGVSVPILRVLDIEVAAGEYKGHCNVVSLRESD